MVSQSHRTIRQQDWLPCRDETQLQVKLHQPPANLLQGMLEGDHKLTDPLKIQMVGGYKVVSQLKMHCIE